MATKQSPFGRVLLITGPETLLADRAVETAVAVCRKEAPTAEFHDVSGEQLANGGLGEITGGSLFASASVTVIRDLASLPADLNDQLLALVKEPGSELALILVHGGGVKGKGLLDKIKKTKPEIITCVNPKLGDLPGFVAQEAKRNRVRMDHESGKTLVDAVGHDLRSLAAAVSQLASDAEADSISVELVRQYFGGRAEVTSFKVADEALAGHTTKALEQLRWAISTGVAPVLITSALASGLRGLGKLQANRSGMGDMDLARDLGVPHWKIRTMRGQLHGWKPAGLARAIQAVAVADADIKGAADTPDYALERCVLAVTSARGR